MKNLWLRAMTDEGTFLRRTVFIFAGVKLLFSIYALAVYPDFALGDAASSKQILGIDFNGWHSLTGILLFLPGVLVVRRTDRTLAYTAGLLVAMIISIIALPIDPTVFGLYDMPHLSGDLIYHVAMAVVVAVILATHLALVSRKTSTETLTPVAAR